MRKFKQKFGFTLLRISVAIVFLSLLSLVVFICLKGFKVLNLSFLLEFL